MYQFPDTFEDEIAEVSTDEEYQNATVRLIDPSLVTGGVYDVETDTYSEEDASSAVLWAGRARIIGVRWGVNRENNDTGNSSTLTTIRVQFPKSAIGRTKRGCLMTVTSCESNPTLETYLFKTTSDLQGSHAASRTLEFSVDGDYIGE